MSVLRMNQASLCVMGVVLGLILILSSFVWTGSFGPGVRWTEQQAAEYAQAALDVHRLTYEQAPDPGHGSHVNTSPSPAPNPVPDSLEKARLRYDEQSASLEAAQAQRRGMARVLKWLGIVVCATSVLGYAVKS